MTTESNLTYYQRNKEKMKVNSHNYYHNNKDRLKKIRDNCAQEKKDQISNYYKTWRNNRTEEEIIKRKEYERN